MRELRSAATWVLRWLGSSGFCVFMALVSAILSIRDAWQMIWSLWWMLFAIYHRVGAPPRVENHPHMHDGLNAEKVRAETYRADMRFDA